MYDSRVYTEVYEIINMLSDKDKEKIPEKWWQLIKTNRDKHYEFDARDEGTILLPDTEKILSVIYTDYLTTEYERKIIKAKEDNFVHKKHNTVLENEEGAKIEIPQAMAEYKSSFLEKLFIRIKKIFRLR